MKLNLKMNFIFLDESSIYLFTFNIENSKYYTEKTEAESL